jgi:CheY-like chemotaxis protein
MMEKAYSFMIIDDSELDRYVTQKFLEHTNKSLIIKTFYNAEDALEVIRRDVDEIGPLITMILLDLQMPIMNGFKFAEEFEKLPPELKKKYRIVVLTILSPAKPPADISRMLTHPAVSGIIEKPLTKEKLLSILDQED